ncbi:hypothetical protein Golob_018201, partial [Gossypium lobatum]|nr:hypothetical protein [Gossypium lobatum]
MRAQRDGCKNNLNGDLHEEIYIEQSLGFVAP